MGRGWRQVGSGFWRWGRRLAPVVISVGLIAWLVWTITPAKLGQALAVSGWPWLVLATAVQVAVLFLWDALNLWWLFSQPARPLSWRTVLRARTDTVLYSAINLEVGQGAFAWKLARARGEPVTEALGRCLALALFDFGTLQGLALVGSFLKPVPLVRSLRWVCLVSVGGLLLLAVLLHLLPGHWRRWLEGKTWASWLKWWGWRHSVLLAAQRLIMFLLVILYAGVCLAICRVPVDARDVIALIPWVMVAEALPGTGGLGEREAALVYLLGSGGPERAVLLGFGLIWSVGTILGRVAIGLVSSWLPHAKEGPPAAEATPA